jgi:hypothetical protein
MSVFEIWTLYVVTNILVWVIYNYVAYFIYYLKWGTEFDQIPYVLEWIFGQGVIVNDQIEQDIVTPFGTFTKQEWERLIFFLLLEFWFLTNFSTTSIFSESDQSLASAESLKTKSRPPSQVPSPLEMDGAAFLAAMNRLSTALEANQNIKLTQSSPSSDTPIPVT